MAHTQSKYADFEGPRERAVALRRGGYSLRQIRDELKIYNNDILNQLVKGEPPPEWTKHPRAKDDLRERAREAGGDKDKPYARRENVTFVNPPSTRRASRSTTPRRCARTSATPTGAV